VTKVRAVYQAIVALSTDGVCDANQRQIIQLAQISERHFRRILHDLEELGLIRTERHYHFRQRKTKNLYFILGQPDSGSPVGGAIGLPESGMHACCMLHGEVERKNWNLLDFLNEPERSLRAAQCAPDLVQAWRALKDFRDQNDLWGPLGFKNPIGWINKELKEGHPPPPLQIPLPGGAIDLSVEFKSRGMTREEIEAQHPARQAGFTLGEDGMWR